MPMAESDEQRIIEFERLNLLGKAVFVTGAAVRTTASLIDRVLERAADVLVEAERAFKEGRGADVDEAKVLEEYDEHRRGPRVPPGAGR